MKKYVIIFALLSFLGTFAQESNEEKLPYYQIPEYPESYTAGTVSARMLDGLGFRYYWATEGLREEDLAFKPNDEARTSAQTLEHIYNLTQVILNATLNVPNIRGVAQAELSNSEIRRQTLLNIKTAADILRNTEDLSAYKIIFQGDKGSTEFPFWNNINGPIADALWHCGQIVLLRRSSGNPFNSKVSVFNGNLRD